MSESTMWAVQYNRYGGPEELTIGEVARPRVSRQQVLIEVAGFSVNAIDLMSRQGKMKGLNGIGFPKGSGVDFAGVVVEAGTGVTNFTVGDHVWGYIGMKPPGAHAAAAQYVVMNASQITQAPSTIPLEEASALPLVGLTALQGLRDVLNVTAGQRVLVVGGSGGIGTTAIQIANAFGATVDAVAGSRTDVAKLAGADTVHDYRSTRPEEITSRYDAILNAATTDLPAYRRLLNRGGRMAALTPAAIPAILASAVTPGKMIRLVAGKSNVNDLRWLASAVEKKDLIPFIASTHSFKNVVDAHRISETEPAAGKRIITTNDR